jgi:hypothetical protein
MTLIRYIVSFALVYHLGLGIAHAQIGTLEDTLSVLSPDFYKAVQSTRNKRFKTDSLYFQTFQRNRLNFSQTNMAQLVSDSLKQAAILEVQYGNGRRGIKLPTNAYRTNMASLYTEGFTTIGKAKILGKFYFDKVWEDSLSNNLGGDLENGIPFTYFATKAGKYERQNINFEAGIAYPILKSLYLNSLINYDYHWSTGSVDPRPDEKIFHIKYSPGLSYKIGQTTIGANYVLAKKDGSIDIGYKNRMFSTSQLYPDRRLYINNGMGYIAQLTSEIYGDYKVGINSWGVQLSTKLYGWMIKANYSNQFNKRINFNRITQADTIRVIDGPAIIISGNIKEIAHSRYETVVQTLNALLQKDFDNYTHQLSFEGLINEGTAQLMSVPTGANYLFDEHSASFNYLLSLKKDGRLNAEWSINGAVTHFTKKDFLSQHFYENTRSNLSIQGGKYLYGKKYSLKITAQPGLITPLANSLQVPETQVNVFTKSIAYPEYDFRGSTFFTGKLGLVYYSPSMLRLAGSSISLNIDYLQKLKDSDIDRSLVPASVGKNQLQVSLGFQIFL